MAAMLNRNISSFSSYLIPKKIMMISETIDYDRKDGDDDWSYKLS